MRKFLSQILNTFEYVHLKCTPVHPSQGIGKGDGDMPLGNSHAAEEF